MSHVPVSCGYNGYFSINDSDIIHHEGEIVSGNQQPVGNYASPLPVNKDAAWQGKNGNEKRPLLVKQTETKTVKSINKHYHRYFICTLILLAFGMDMYADSTFSIASIGMISSDVLESGLTELRARLAVSKEQDIALPGTCPVHVDPQVSSRQVNDANKTQLNQVKLDAADLIVSLEADISEGRLVNWSIKERGVFLSAHTVGGLVFTLPIGYLAIRFGSTKVILVAVASNAIRLLLLPVISVRAPFWFTIAVQFVVGGLGACIHSIAYPLASAWLLPSEANAFVALFLLSRSAGISLTNLITSQLLYSGIEWCWCFYIPGKSRHR